MLNNFINIKNNSNIKIIKCINELFSKNGLKNNIGNYCLLSIILSDIVCLILFIIKGFTLLNNIIDKNIYENNDINNININNNKKKDITIKNEMNNKKNNNRTKKRKKKK